jgi:hypothetical protein
MIDDSRLLRYFAIGLTAVAVGLLFAPDADAHTATPTAAQPLGWQYGWECCNLMDCRQVAHAAVEESPQGYVIKATGEVIPYSSKKIKQSKDEFFHWCSKGGKPDAETICLYVPNRGF